VATNEEVVYHVRLQGAQQVAAEARTASAAMTGLKTSARPLSTLLAPGALAPGQTHAQWTAATQAEIASMQRRVALMPGGSAYVAKEAAKAEEAAIRRRPAFGERGRAVASAAGAGRFASLAAPFGGWGPLAAIGGGFMALNQFKGALAYESRLQQVQAQTIAGIRSTGGAAHVSAAHVEELAKHLGSLGGVQRDVVHDSENILLTFTKIRNETGKGNKVFDQASLAVANVAARMHTSMPQAALQLGKALNDPIRGLGALRRIGVQFSNQQVDQIKVMVASGNVLGAQKIILQELTTEFGGSAKAAGKTFPASMERLQQSWDDARGKLVKGLLPALTRLADMLSKNLPGAINDLMTAFSIFNNDPKQNVMSRWVHRTFGGTVGDAFDYTLRRSGKDMVGDLARKELTHKLNVTPGYSGSAADKLGLSERQRQQAAVGGQMLDANGNVVKGLGAPFAQPTVKVHWDATDVFSNQPIQLVVDGQVLAKANTKAQQKRTHSEGRGSTR